MTSGIAMSASELRQVGQHGRQRCPLCEQACHKWSRCEARGHGDGQPARAGPVGRELLDPGGAGAERRAAGDACDESTGEQQTGGVAARDEQRTGEHGGDQRGQQHHATAVPVGQQATDQQRGHQTERVEAEGGLHGRGGQTEFGLVEQQ
jgi:hypothetical protein